MRPAVFSANLLRQFLRRNRIATLPQLKEMLGTEADITVFRKLKELSYCTSYSHRGSFYTLDEIAAFDERGLWSFDSVWFSRHGTLVATAEACVTRAPAGYYASELERILHVPVKEPLLQLVEQDRIARQTVSGLYWYSASNPPARQQQLQARQVLLESAAAASPVSSSDELRAAAIVLFASLLDEKQRPPDRRPSPSGPAHGGQRTTTTVGPRAESGQGTGSGWRTQTVGKKTPAVIDANAKKRELIGNAKNPGVKWELTPTDVNDHDFRSAAKGIANPYGIVRYPG